MRRKVIHGQIAPIDSWLGGSVRFFSIGGRKTRGGFSGFLGKDPQVKQGVAEGVPRRIPGTTKVTYTNKKGRSFVFSVPLSEITHPPVNRTNAVGGWKEMDTSFCDLGDIEDDMPSAVDELLNINSDESNLTKLQEAFLLLCKEYVLMDTSGMKNTHTFGELNVGPDYQHYDRKLRRKRHWLSIRHRFDDVREIIWPHISTDGNETECYKAPPPLTPEQMLETLLWLEAASTFCVRKVSPADLAGPEEFLPLDLSSEVQVVAHHVRSHPDFFRSASFDRYISCAALCANHNVPFNCFFPTADPAAGDEITKNTSCMLVNAPKVESTFEAIRLMRLLAAAEDPNAYIFTDEQGIVVRCDVMFGLLRLMAPEVVGSSDILANVGEEELFTLLEFCAVLRERNALFFDSTSKNLQAAETAKESEVSGADVDAVGNAAVVLRIRFKQLTQVALARCRHLLYRLDGTRERVMTEGGDIPIVELQQHTERTQKDAIVHFKLGMRSAQGLRRVSLSATASARLAALVERVEAHETGSVHGGGGALLSDLLHHLAHKTSASKASLSLREINAVLPLLAGLRGDAARLERLFAAMGTAIGAAMRASPPLGALVCLMEGLAQCRFVPSSFAQLEAVLLRRMADPRCDASHVTRVLCAFAALRDASVGVSSLLLEAAATHARRLDSAAELIALLRALHMCGYAALPGLVAGARRRCEPLRTGFSLSHTQRCHCAALFSAAALAAKGDGEHVYPNVGSRPPEVEAAVSALAEDSRRMFVAHARSTARETDAELFADCITGLAAFGVPRERDSVPSLVAYLRGADCMTSRRCAAFSLTAAVALLEGIQHWGEALDAPLEARNAAAPIDAALLDKVRASNQTPSDELAEGAYRLILVPITSEPLRRAAAEVLGSAILCAEKEVTAVHEAKMRGSFEATALASTERKDDVADTVVRYCAALQQSGLAEHVERNVLYA